MPSSSRFSAAIRGLRRRKEKAGPVQITPRIFMPAELDLPSLARLPEEILSHIVDLIGELSPESLDDVSSVCSYLYDKVSIYRHRQVVLNILDENAARARLGHVSQRDRLTAVRALRVACGHDRHPRSYSPALSLLISIVPKMAGLRDVYWSGGVVPGLLLQQLAQRSQVRLHVNVETRGQGRRDPPGPRPIQLLLESLVGCSSLVSLRVKAEYKRATECRQVTKPLKSVLLSCPRLRSLDLDIYSVRSSVLEYVGLRFQDGQRPPPLEELRIHRYPMGRPARAGGPVLFDTQGYPRDEPEEEHIGPTRSTGRGYAD
ncbi:hypothetical protein F5B17DRAFT_143487 [Nemania serpens]|nr:hypothetical protein F5B17DRAFT_143487 [Nemania serpens]